MKFMETHNIITRNQDMKQKYDSPLYSLLKTKHMKCNNSTFTSYQSTKDYELKPILSHTHSA